jgi:hypothetical protein
LLNWNFDFDNPNESEDEWQAENGLHIVLDNVTEDAECSQQRHMRVGPTVPGLIQPTQMSKRNADKWVMGVYAIQIRRIRER